MWVPWIVYFVSYTVNPCAWTVQLLFIRAEEKKKKRKKKKRKEKGNVKLKTQTRNKPNPNGHYIYITELGRVRAGFWKKKNPDMTRTHFRGFFFFFFNPNPTLFFIRPGFSPLELGTLRVGQKLTSLVNTKQSYPNRRSFLCQKVHAERALIPFAKDVVDVAFLKKVEEGLTIRD